MRNAAKSSYVQRALLHSPRDSIRSASRFACRSSRGSDCRFTSSQLSKANERKTDALLRGGTRARANRSEEIAAVEFTAGREGVRSPRWLRGEILKKKGAPLAGNRR